MKPRNKRNRRYVHHVKTGKIKGGSGGSAGSMEQLDLSHGSMAYKEYVAERTGSLVLANNTTSEKKPSDDVVEEKQFESEVEPSVSEASELAVKKRKLHDAYLRGNSIGYNTDLRRRKRGQVKKAKKVIEEGLDCNISKRDFDDEIYDNGITADEFMHEAVKDHASEFDKMYNQSSSNDDEVDMDTPAGRRMRKYL